MFIKEYYGNASSTYELGLASRRLIEDTRSKIKKEINADPEDQIIFLSGASEANTLAIDGFLKFHPDYNCITTNIEHSSILENPNVDIKINCDEYGFFKIEDLEGYSNSLFAIQAANNEIGTYQDIKKISSEIHKKNNVFFTDATQMFGHIPIDVKNMGIDMMSASAHKLGGLKGCGFLYVKNGIQLSPIIYGTQENGLRGGTYNTLGIITLGKAVELINYKNEFEIQKKRDYLIKDLLEIDNITLNGSIQKRLPGNVNICIHNMKITSQQLVSLLDIHGYYVSAASACHSGDTKLSHVLKAIGLSDEEAKCNIRISIGENTTFKELNDFVKCLKILILQYSYFY